MRISNVPPHLDVRIDSSSQKYIALGEAHGRDHIDMSLDDVNQVPICCLDQVDVTVYESYGHDVCVVRGCNYADPVAVEGIAASF